MNCKSCPKHQPWPTLTHTHPASSTASEFTTLCFISMLQGRMCLDASSTFHWGELPWLQTRPHQSFPLLTTAVLSFQWASLHMTISLRQTTLYLISLNKPPSFHIPILLYPPLHSLLFKFSAVVVTNHHTNNRNLFSHSSQGQKSKISITSPKPGVGKATLHADIPCLSQLLPAIGMRWLVATSLHSSRPAASKSQEKGIQVKGLGWSTPMSEISFKMHQKI